MISCFRNKEFEGFLQTLKHKPCFVMGDLNCAPHPVDLHNPKVEFFALLEEIFFFFSTNEFQGNLMSAGFSKEEREDFHNLLNVADLVDSYRHLHPVADLSVSLGQFECLNFFCCIVLCGVFVCF